MMKYSWVRSAQNSYFVHALKWLRPLLALNMWKNRVHLIYAGCKSAILNAEDLI